MIKNFISTLLARFQSEDEEGQTLVEYGLLLALIAIIVIVALLFLGPFVCDIFSNVGNAAQRQLIHSSTTEAPRRASGPAAVLRPRHASTGGDHRRQYHRSVAHKSSRWDLPRVRRLLTAVTTRALLRALIRFSSTRAKGDSS